MMIRACDILFSFLGLVVLSPVLLLVYLAVVCGSRGGGFFSQVRVGKNGRDFTLYKFRTMKGRKESGSGITVGGRDPRITRVGYYLRKFKLDELPQLYNVLKGDMSLVGPRPELRRYVDLYTPAQRQVLQVPPGITDYASIEYADENEMLGRAEDPEQEYIRRIMPDKIRLNRQYIEKRSIKEYFKVIFLTLRKIVAGR